VTDRLDDARWRAAIDACLVDGADAAQRALVESYTPDDDAARVEQALLAELAAGDAPAHPDDERQVAAAVATFFAEREPAIARRRLGPAIAIAAAVVLASAAWWRLAPRAIAMDPTMTPLAAIELRPAAIDPPPAPAVVAPAWQLERGELVVEPAIASAVPLGVPTRARSSSCMRHGDAQVCVDAGGEFIARAEGATPELELVDGAATVAAGAAATVQLQVVVAGTRVAIADASEVVVTIERRAWTIEITRGRASIDRDGSTLELVAGERLQGGGVTVRAAKPDPDDLLAQARALRSSGDLDGAARAYAKLIDAHRGSTVAHTAQVSLGEIHLERGRPKPALAAFDRYLRRGGALAEEASFGRIRALRALGRDAAAREAAADFERRFPGSAYAAKLRGG
jgi:tetratricopeptide (TPR) repeat protein